MGYYLTTFVFPVIGGLAMLLYGMQLMSQGLVRVAGKKLKYALKTLTKNRFYAILTGIVTTAVVQSSSVITVMVVGFLNASLISLERAIGVILGSNIGTTFTAQLIAFRIHEYSLLAIGLGVLLVLFSKRDRLRFFGNILLGFGLIFFGLSLIESSLEPLKNNASLHEFFLSVGDRPFFGILLGMVVTMILQSSAAAVGMTMAFAVSGIIDFETSVYIIFGLNIGTTLTANLAAIHANTSAKRAARIHIINNVAGTLFVLLFLPLFFGAVDMLTPSDDIVRKIANAHTLFNVISVFIFVPFISQLSRLSTMLVPDGKSDQNTLNYLDQDALTDASIALDRVDHALTEMAERTIESFGLTAHALCAKERDLGHIRFQEDTIDMYQEKILDYCNSVTELPLHHNEIRRIESAVHIVNSLEKIGDFSYRIAKIINAVRTETKGFTTQEKRIFSKLFVQTLKLMRVTRDLIETRNRSLIADFLSKFQNVRREIRTANKKYQRVSRRGNIVRMNYSVHILGHLDDLAFKTRNIAYIVENRRGAERDEY